MDLVSVIIPSRNEKWLATTIEDIYRRFKGNFEVLVVMDGDTEFAVPKIQPNLHIINEPSTEGIRSSINKAVALSQGNILLKLDAHCAFSDGFDTTLQSSLEDDQVAVARRYTLDLGCWEPRPRIVDYYYLSCPWTHPHSLMMQSCPWITHTNENFRSTIDDLMCFQGSMWMMSRKHWDWLGGLEIGEETYAEHHEISMKTWLGGRRVVINKAAWYAHPRSNTRGYYMDMDQVYRDHAHSAHYWIENKWKERVHDFDWLIERFWPLPLEHNRHRTEKYYWPESWREHYGVVS